MDNDNPKQKLEPGVFEGNPDTASKEGMEKIARRQISTMKLDAMEAINKQNETVVSIMAAEGRKTARLREEADLVKKAELEKNHAPKRRGRLMVIFIFLLLVSLLGVAYVLLQKINLPELPSVSFPSLVKNNVAETNTIKTESLPLAPSIIPSQSEKRFNISKENAPDIIEVINSEKGLAIPAGSIKNLYFAESYKSGLMEISANRFFIFIGARAPETMSSILERPFMAGFYGEANGGATPFLILKVSDHNTGVAGMLEWEATLPRFFDTLFGTNIESESGANFKDIVVSGKDARSIETNLTGNITYSFVNDFTILITGSHPALEALLPLAGKN